MILSHFWIKYSVLCVCLLCIMRGNSLAQQHYQKVFSIASYGAMADVQTDNAADIQQTMGLCKEPFGKS